MPDRASPISSRIGATLRARRESLGLSQAGVAATLGKTQTWLSYIEAGKREPRLADLDALLRELDMALELRSVAG